MQWHHGKHPAHCLVYGRCSVMVCELSNCECRLGGKREGERCAKHGKDFPKEAWEAGLCSNDPTWGYACQGGSYWKCAWESVTCAGLNILSRIRIPGNSFKTSSSIFTYKMETTDSVYAHSRLAVLPKWDKNWCPRDSDLCAVKSYILGFAKEMET